MIIRVCYVEEFAQRVLTLVEVHSHYILYRVLKAVSKISHDQLLELEVAAAMVESLVDEVSD